MIAEFAPEAKITVTHVDESGIYGQVKLLLWNVDFVARLSCTAEGEVSIEVAAHKLVPIPGMIVNRQLREAVKDAPPGVDVIQQALKVHLPSLLRPFGASLGIQEIRTYSGYIRLKVDKVRLPNLKELLGKKE